MMCRDCKNHILKRHSCSDTLKRSASFLCPLTNPPAIYPYSLQPLLDPRLGQFALIDLVEDEAGEVAVGAEGWAVLEIVPGGRPATDRLRARRPQFFPQAQLGGIHILLARIWCKDCQCVLYPHGNEGNTGVVKVAEESLLFLGREIFYALFINYLLVYHSAHSTVLSHLLFV